MTTVPVIEPVPTVRRRLLPARAGRQHQAGPVTYAVLIVVALASLFPLYWTLVAASTDTQRVVSTPPPLVPGGNLFKNLSYVWVHAGNRGWASPCSTPPWSRRR